MIRTLRRHRLIHRAAHWGLLAWAVLFFVIIAPGHVRGLVEYEIAQLTTTSETSTLADLVGLSGAPVIESLPACCQPTAPSEDGPVIPVGKRCAVCQIVATCDVPPAMLFFVPSCERLGRCHDEPAHHQYDRTVERRYAGRAPPAVA